MSRLGGTTGGYKVTKIHLVCKGVGVAHSTAWISRGAEPWEREGAMLSSVSEGGKDRRLRCCWKLQIRFENFRGNYTGRPSRSLDLDCESPWKKMIGKPHSGKLNVRFDEGELEIGH